MKTNMMELSKFVKWSVCGDGCVFRSAPTRNALYTITRSPEHEDYLNVIENKLSQLPDCKIYRYTYTRKDNGKTVLSLSTTVHPLFSRVRDRQYIHGHKVIDPHMLTMLDWESTAFLFMDDGSLCVNNRGSLVTRLSTCAYSYPEQEALRKAFMDKLGIIWNINRTGKNLWQLNLTKQSRDTFFSGIKEYIVPSYMYKLPEFLQEGTSRPDDDLV